MLAGGRLLFVPGTAVPEPRLPADAGQSGVVPEHLASGLVRLAAHTLPCVAVATPTCTKPTVGRQRRRHTLPRPMCRASLIGTVLFGEVLGVANILGAAAIACGVLAIALDKDHSSPVRQDGQSLQPQTARR